MTDAEKIETAKKALEPMAAFYDLCVRNDAAYDYLPNLMLWAYAGEKNFRCIGTAVGGEALKQAYEAYRAIGGTIS